MGACGCTSTSTYFPTVALNELYYGSSSSYGPGCGVCFNISLASAIGAIPAFVVPEENRTSLVVKVTVGRTQLA